LLRGPRRVRRLQRDSGHRAGGDGRFEEIHDLGIELRAPSFSQLRKRLVNRERGAIDPVRGHGVEGISHRDDPSA
jgi:hypothetical protein